MTRLFSTSTAFRLCVTGVALALGACSGRYVEAPASAVVAPTARSGTGPDAATAATAGAAPRNGAASSTAAPAATGGAGTAAGSAAVAGNGERLDGAVAGRGGDRAATDPAGADGTAGTAPADRGKDDIASDESLAALLAGGDASDSTATVDGAVTDRREGVVQDRYGSAVTDGSGPASGRDAADRRADDVAMLDRAPGTRGDAASAARADAERAGRVEAAANRIELRDGEKPQTLDGMLPLVLSMDETREMFEFDRWALNDDARGALDTLAAKLQDAPYERLVITGFADRIGTEAYNQRLSEKRAWAVAGYLMDKGVPPHKLTVEGRGERDGVTDFEACRGLKRAEMIDCLQRDRRVEIAATVREVEVRGRD
ncbi:MAG: OmpA family protein [Burkholderiales bacterium]|jgi:outer membrane protein OmpA-like peptidoglycan-associated protein|nr:OmpA family protein [Burkholderiales bacterium]